MFRIMTRLDSNGRFIPIINLGKQYWAVEDLEDGGKNIYHLTREYLLENSSKFENVKVSAAGRVSVTPSQIDLEAFETHYRDAYCQRYKSMPNRTQAKIYQEYSENLDLGDILIKKHPELIRKLVLYRGDIFSSDREIAAMAYAVRNMIF